MDTNTNNTGPTNPPSPEAMSPGIAKPDFSQPSASAGIPKPPASIPPSTPPPASHKGPLMIWVIILLTFALVCGLVFAFWYFQSQLKQEVPQKTVSQTPVEAPKTFVIGTDATFQPMEYIASGGALMGYDIDLGNRVAAELGTK